MTDEQIKERLAILQAEVGELEQENKANSIIKSQIQSKEEFEEGYAENYTKEAASATPGALLGDRVAKLVTKHPAVRIPSAIVSSIASAPYVKPYTDKMVDALNDPANKRVIPLGDDFDQGLPMMGTPSILDNSMVPYETVDSSSTGVIRPNVPQL